MSTNRRQLCDFHLWLPQLELLQAELEARKCVHLHVTDLSWLHKVVDDCHLLELEQRQKEEQHHGQAEEENRQKPVARTGGVRGI